MACSSSFQYRFETLRSSIAGVVSEQVNEESIIPTVPFDAGDEQGHGRDDRDEHRPVPRLDRTDDCEVEQVDHSGCRIEVQPWSEPPQGRLRVDDGCDVDPDEERGRHQELDVAEIDVQ